MNKQEFILWGTKIGDFDYKEQIITETKSVKHLDKAKKWALDNGFDRLRIMEFNGEKPDFTGTVNIK